MGTRERRERARRGMRQSILQAARTTAQHEGWHSVTIRKVAEMIEYSPPTIYEYFNSKEEILSALFCEGYLQLAQQLHAARFSVDNYEERLLRMVEAYWSFSVSNPEMFQVMHGVNGVPLYDYEAPEGMITAIELAKEALLDWSRNEGFTIDDPGDRVDILRGLADGLILLSMTDDIKGGEEHAKSLLRRTVHDLLVAWSFQAKS